MVIKKGSEIYSPFNTCIEPIKLAELIRHSNSFCYVKLLTLQKSFHHSSFHLKLENYKYMNQNRKKFKYVNIRGKEK